MEVVDRADGGLGEAAEAVYIDVRARWLISSVLTSAMTFVETGRTNSVVRRSKQALKGKKTSHGGQPIKL